MHFNFCDYEWVGIAGWWLSQKSSEQASWVQAIGSILAIAVAIYIANHQQRSQQKNKEEDNKKIVMSAAANLYVALEYQSAILDFSPKGDGVIGYDEITVTEAMNMIKLTQRTQDALEMAIDKSHFFPKDVCSEIVKLSLSCSAYNRVIEEIARFKASKNTDEFFQKAAASSAKINEQINLVREKLIPFIPQI